MKRPNDFLPDHFFVWCQHTFIGSWIAHGSWIFPVIETIHIMAFSVVLGTTLMIDMRLLGSGVRRTPTQQITRELEPWMLTALLITVCSGACLFLSEAERLGANAPFFYKMCFFALAIVVHFTIHWKASMRGVGEGALFGKIAACLSLLCWFGVALSGRAIAFLT